MAEALGLVASVIQLIDAVCKLRDLWNSVKNAPDDLVDCVHDIQRTARLLDKSKKLASGSTGTSDDHLTECTQDLDHALAALQSVTSDLQKGLHHNKRLGAFKIVLKKDDITRGRRKLERAQSLLSTAQQNLALATQLQQTSMLNQNHALLLQVYSVVQTTTQNALINSSPSHIASPGAATTPPRNTSAARLADCCSRPISRRSREAHDSYSVQFPLWLTRRCFKIVCSREMSSLHFTFTSYNVVDTYSSVHTAARGGDLELLKKLFDAGEASPFDQTEHGETLLSSALMNHKVNVAQFLVTRYPSLASGMDLTSLPRSFPGWISRIETTDLAEYFDFVYQMWVLITKFVDIDEDMLHDIGQRFHALYGMPDVWAEWLPLMPRAASAGVESLPKEARMWLAGRTTSVEWFERLKSSDISTREVLELYLHPANYQACLLDNIIDLLLSHEGNAKLLKWSPIVREVFEFERCKGPTYSWLRYILRLDNNGNNGNNGPWWRSKMSSLSEFWNNTLHKWIRYLEDIGVDLMEYGHREAHKLKQDGVAQLSCWRYIGFSHGPKPTNWKFFVLPDGVEYEWAGEFWKWTENPELFFVPGTFPVDEKHISEYLLELDEDFDDRRRMRWQSRMRQGHEEQVVSAE